MSPDTSVTRNGGNHSLLWLAGAVGTTVGIASWVYSRRECSRWDTAKRRVGRFVENSTENARPWMAAAAGAAVGTAALAYRRRQNRSAWDLAVRRARNVLSRAPEDLKPWMGLAASTAISLASAYRRPPSVAKDVKASAAAASEKFADAGARLVSRIQRLSKESRRLYPKVRQLIA